ncbi:MAG: DUF4129 domain-containing protein [Chloroflexota bacterium]
MVAREDESVVEARNNILRLAALVLAVLALAALAVSLDTLTLQPGQPLRLSPPSTIGGGQPGGAFDIRLLFVGLLWATLLISAIGLIVSPSLRRYLLRNLPLYLLYGLLAYLLFTNLQSCAAEPAGNPAPSGMGESAQPPPLPEPAPLVTPEYISSPPQWLVLLVSFALGLAVVGAIWLLVYRARRQKPASAQAQIVRGAQNALAEIEAGAELIDEVLRCYAEMSRVLSGQRGVQRDKAMTPREFESRLAAAGLRDEHIRRLTRLFESVRYGSREPGEREEREAVECLQAIVAAYTSSPADDRAYGPRATG